MEVEVADVPSSSARGAGALRWARLSWPAADVDGLASRRVVYRLRARPGLVLDAGSAVAGLFRCRDDAGGARSVVRGRRGTDGFRSWSAVTVATRCCTAAG